MFSFEERVNPAFSDGENAVEIQLISCGACPAVTRFMLG
ncbi:hypothetical protein CEV32_0530 [Brucella rhizosphaerae]|uniref:Uncharacterized protein n=1 Tax=Brucella rhizosphaerae TaxID=571254 RepID=A0A256FI35_9HYPH|nr:hypothetical protein CEV32_0530 [Brucella rhizosphaerae]